LLERGVARVVVGSLAVEDPAAVRALAAQYPGRVAVGLDHRAGRVQVRGWAEASTLTLAAALAAVESADLAAVVVTEIERDGMLTGPDLDGLAAVLDLTTTPVIASGGVCSVVDLRALAGLRGAAGGGRLEGVIVGKAIYEGRVELDAGLRAVRVGPVAR
jgi:phosphoribosylformimino-5-aminoimidazole carboxamide ribotide isomerase